MSPASPRTLLCSTPHRRGSRPRRSTRPIAGAASDESPTRANGLCRTFRSAATAVAAMVAVVDGQRRLQCPSAPASLGLAGGLRARFGSCAEAACHLVASSRVRLGAMLHADTDAAAWLQEAVRAHSTHPRRSAAHHTGVCTPLATVSRTLRRHAFGAAAGATPQTLSAAACRSCGVQPRVKVLQVDGCMYVDREAAGGCKGSRGWTTHCELMAASPTVAAAAAHRTVWRSRSLRQESVAAPHNSDAYGRAMTRASW